ncbi:transcriptional regulator [Prosthecochloris sp. ZM]|uniref:ArsR/SmtB family transcription factor n=1 Tax=Prosthecochloris sp. ZM TaxID=2283143 RepID=UPI000DF845DD|nr:metalloregulator ArsR/SmtB family transcription factor [Prosthecochloris sp. ZM]RDD30292.1 transcriptional regulator [Prosthecochloris sp. ZM]
MSDAEKTARMFKVLSVGSRVRMVELLKERSLCVNALARTLGITAAAVSQHLRVLRDTGLVCPEKHGYYVHYRINHEALQKWKESALVLLGASSEDSHHCQQLLKKGEKL